jgi:hypothetical protein
MRHVANTHNELIDNRQDHANVSPISICKAGGPARKVSRYEEKDMYKLRKIKSMYISFAPPRMVPCPIHYDALNAGFENRERRRTDIRRIDDSASCHRVRERPYGRRRILVIEGEHRRKNAPIRLSWIEIESNLPQKPKETMSQLKSLCGGSLSPLCCLVLP